MKKQYFFTTWQVLVITLLFSACAKDKLQDILLQAAQVNSSASSIRLFNFYNLDADVTVNNIPLTSYSSNQATQTGLSIFPTGVWPNNDDGSPFTIPVSLLDKQGRAHILIAPTGVVSYQAYVKGIDTVLQNDPLNPKDYYLLFDGSMRIVPRNTAAPTQPDHFNIRILNLMQTMDDQGYTGRVTLTYADGTAVSPVTSGIDSNHTSGYVELPLGVYQFKLFLSRPDGSPDYTKQLAELPVTTNFNGFNETVAGQPKDQEALFPKIRTFKAGATYSLVITKGIMSRSYTDPGGNNLHWDENVNAYRLVTEQTQGANTTYACMDAVNTLRLQGVSILVDGQVLGSNLSFGQSVGHKIYVWGNHQVQAVDQQGNVIAEKDIMMYANNYLTAWTYLNPSGQADIVFSSTDMTSTIYQTNEFGAVVNYAGGSGYAAIPDDGTNGSLRVSSSNYNWQSRFLNLSEDIPYVTFGDDSITSEMYAEAGGDLLFPQPSVGESDSTTFAAATINLGQGVTNVGEPFLMYDVYGPGSSSYYWSGQGGEGISLNGMPGSQIIVFQSEPGPPAIVPGQLLVTVPGLKWKTFVANPTMYTVSGLTPKAEPGFYSVALIGKVAEAASGQAKLIYIKHNQ
jgi:hypothetical protein